MVPSEESLHAPVLNKRVASCLDHAQRLIVALDCFSRHDAYIHVYISSIVLLRTSECVICIYYIMSINCIPFQNKSLITRRCLIHDCGPTEQ